MDGASNECLPCGKPTRSFDRSFASCKPLSAASGEARTACYTPPSVAHHAALPKFGPQRPALPTQSRNRRVNVLDEIVQDQLRTDLPEIATGDTVKVSAKVVEGNRERIQVFEGTVMRLRGGGITRSITVRRIASGVGVERTFKIHSPRIDKIEVLRHGEVRRAQLYFLRKRVGKAATLRERRANN
jgi:large subunit ribosomal protein L19